MKIIVIGSVISSKVILQKLIEHGIDVVYVFSLDEVYSKNVSGYYPIHEIAEEHKIPYKKIRRINELENIEIIKSIKADYIFAVGISQLVCKEIIEAATLGTIGFHPTPLPKYRGRAAMVWQMLLEVKTTKCSMFFIDDGMDSGDIIGQEPYEIDENDYAIDVEKKLLKALERLMDRVAEQIKENTLTAIPQNEDEATYLLMRTPEDGHIDWNQPAKEVQKLIRAVSHPYPGAFALYEGKQKVVFWKADWKENTKYIGFPGQIADVTNEKIVVLCQQGLIEIYDYEVEGKIKFKIGHKFY